MDKNQLRKHYKQLRKALSENQKEEWSLAIANKCLELPIWKADFYHLFLSISKLDEINTDYLLHILNGKDKHVVVSKSDFNQHRLAHFLLTDNTRLVVNKFGIPEPVSGISIEPKQLDVVFVPLLAFDEKGHRTGYGKGFYDRFLSECKPECLKIGLSFFEATPNPIATNPTDVALDYCVTPDKVYRF